MSGLSMKVRCEKCETALAMTAEAYVCSYECTFCARCARAFELVCPNCRGELVRRPRRAKREACPVEDPSASPAGQG